MYVYGIIVMSEYGYMEYMGWEVFKFEYYRFGSYNYFEVLRTVQFSFFYRLKIGFQEFISFCYFFQVKKKQYFILIEFFLESRD